MTVSLRNATPGGPSGAAAARPAHTPGPSPSAADALQPADRRACSPSTSPSPGTAPRPAAGGRAPAIDLATIAAVAQANFVLAVLPRQQHVVNLAGWMATRPRRPGRCGCAGRSGSTTTSVVCTSGPPSPARAGTSLRRLDRSSSSPAAPPTVDGAERRRSPLAVVVVFVVMVPASPCPGAGLATTTSSRPPTGSGRGRRWRSCGSTPSLAAGRATPARPLGAALLETPTVWLLVLTTALAIWPWLLLRRVPVTVERPSAHAAIVHVDHDIASAVGTTRAISRRPSSAGTTSPSSRRRPAAPATAWSCRVPATGPARSSTTRRPTSGCGASRPPASPTCAGCSARSCSSSPAAGSGPGSATCSPPRCPTKLVWITRDPRRTYGDASRRRGARRAARRPDLEHRRARQARRPRPRLRRRTWTRGAEAVICIANRRRHVAGRARPRAARHPGVRADLGLVSGRARIAPCRAAALAALTFVACSPRAPTTMTRRRRPVRRRVDRHGRAVDHDDRAVHHGRVDHLAAHDDDPVPPTPATVAELLALDRPIVLAHTGGEDEFPGSTLFGFGESMKPVSTCSTSTSS